MLSLHEQKLTLQLLFAVLDGGHVLDEDVVFPDERLDARQVLAHVFAAHQLGFLVDALVQVVGIPVEGVAFQGGVQGFPVG